MHWTVYESCKVQFVKIVCHLNYCPRAWHFCNKGLLLRIERVEEGGSKFVYNYIDMSYSQALSRSNKQYLHVQRLRCMSVEVITINLDHSVYLACSKPLEM